MQDLRLTWEERVESVKAGSVSMGAIALVFPLTVLVNEFLASRFPAVPLNYWISGATALFAGFLFGVTYRYIIRQDQNAHLASGAVLAFGLVRGFAQIEIGLTTESALIPVAAWAIESVLLFAIARVLLDWTMRFGWIERFRG